MATSGTVTYRANALTIAKAAIRLCGGYDSEGATATTTQLADALEAFNMLVKTYQAIGLQLWERKFAVVFPQKAQAVYVLGSPGPAGDHACLTTPMNGGFVLTTLSSAAASGAVSISVASTTGQLSTVGNTAVSITDTYYIGIQLDSGATFWTTVSGAPSGTTVSLASGLSGAAASGNSVFCYQTKLIRPLRILDAFVRQATQGNDSPIKPISRDAYNRFGLKTSQGTPVQLYYDAQENTGHLYVYPTPSQATQLIFIEFQKPIEDFSTTADDFDLPQEWAECLKYNLARRIAPEYEVTVYKYNQIKELANETFNIVDSWDQETASLFIQPVDASMEGQHGS